MGVISFPVFTTRKFCSLLPIAAKNELQSGYCQGPIHMLMTEPKRAFPTRPLHPFALHHTGFYLCHSMPRQRAVSAGAAKSACRENFNPYN